MSKESKLEEEIVQHKTSKKFLDLLAIASKNKRPVNQKKRKLMKELAIRSAQASELAEAEQARGSSTFVTQGSQNAIQSKKSLSKRTIGKSSFVKSPQRVSED